MEVDTMAPLALAFYHLHNDGLQSWRTVQGKHGYHDWESIQKAMKEKKVFCVDCFLVLYDFTPVANRLLQLL